VKRPRFSICHPTARVRPYPPSLPRGWQHTCEAFRLACSDPEACEYLMVVHESRWEEFWNGPLGDPAKFLKLRWPHYRIVRNRERDCNVDQVNRIALEAAGEILIGTMDDYFPPQNWDRTVYNAFPNPGAPAVLHFSTGSPRDRELIIGCAMTKAYYDQVGYVLPPEFESMYADDFITRKWRADGVVIERFDIEFEHRHPAFGKAAMDPIYELENRPEAYAQGRELLDRSERAAGAPPVMACLLPGETFSQDYLSAWTNIYGNLLRKWEVHPTFCHSSNVYVTRYEMTQSVLLVKPRADLVLWIDDDNIVTYQQIEMLVKDLEEHPEADAVCGWCWIHNHNTDQWLASCGRTPADSKMMYQALTYEEALSGKFVEVQASGFPVVLMRYAMLEKLGAGAFVPIVGEFVYGFCSEDAAFWKRAMEAGFRLFCDTRVRAHHLKTCKIEPVFVAPGEMARAAD
jgi:hypothetical protein